jgi:hypothetical protein
MPRHSVAFCLFLSALAIFLHTGCGSSDHNTVEHAESPTPSRFCIAVHPGVELLNIVQLLAGTECSRDPSTVYSSEVLEHFGGFHDHEAVRTVALLNAGGFGFDAPVTAMLHLSPPPELILEVPWSNDLLERAGGTENLDRFASALRSFASDTDFKTFWNEQGEAYTRMAELFWNVTGNDDIEMLETYFGMSRSSYSILPAPLSSFGFGSRIPSQNGTWDVYCTIMVPDEIHPAELEQRTARYLRHFVWHEFAHSFVNPVCDDYADQIIEYSSLFEPLRESMTAQAYGSWQICVYEHLVRSVTARLIALEYGETVGSEEIQQQLCNGFAYIEPLYEDLIFFEQNRETEGSFEDYFPEFLETFEDVREVGTSEFTRMTGMNINSVLMLDRPRVYVLPTAEQDAAVQSLLHTYVREVRDMFMPGSEIITDTAALSRDLSGQVLVIYGTPAGNRYLSQICNELPVEIRDDGSIRTGQILTGSRLRFISVFPNPVWNDSWLVIYTACRTEYVIGINSVYHGMTEYVVADDTELLESGVYEKTSMGWKF